MIDEALPGCLALVALSFCLLGLILGITSLVVIRRSGGRLTGVGRARFAILVSLLGLCGAFAGLFLTKKRTDGVDRTAGVVTIFGDFAKVESTQPSAAWFDGGGISGVTAESSGEGQVTASDTELMRKWVKKVGFRDSAARHIASMSIRHHKEKGTPVEVHIWFADVDTQSDPAAVMAMRKTYAGEVTIQSGRFLMGIFTLQHPQGQELVERLYRYYSDLVGRVERGAR